MALSAILGRVLFVSVFLISAWHEFDQFGSNGGPAAKALEPKISLCSNYISHQTGIELPVIEGKYVVAAAIAIKALGSLFFVFGCSLGAQLLLLHQLISLPTLYDFYNYDVDTTEFAQLFVKFSENLALVGALLFFIGMKNSMPRRANKKKTAPKSKTN